jgi:hypothetical protein
LIIDCKTEDLHQAAQFWSAALGRAVDLTHPGSRGHYLMLETPPDEPIAQLQKVDHESRVHIDIETDDIPAEVDRLAALGAQVIARPKRWVVMQAPTGHLFCVVRMQRPGFPKNVHRWGDGIQSSSLSAKKKVLAIGLDPASVDLDALGGFSPVLVRAHIDAQLQEVQLAGFEVTSCLIDPRRSPDVEIASVLNANNFDCVVVGAGLRSGPERLELFERIVNLIHELAPKAKLCFNSSPGDTVQAVRRWF